MYSFCLSNLDEIQEECKLSPIVAYRYAMNQENPILNAILSFWKGCQAEMCWVELPAF